MQKIRFFNGENPFPALYYLEYDSETGEPGFPAERGNKDLHMAKVYFIPAAMSDGTAAVAARARRLLEHLLDAESVELASEIPLKTHFGEHGNHSFIPAAAYDGIIDFLLERKIKGHFMETSVLYGGKRYERASHTRLALDHGFTRLPVVMADGAAGEDAVPVPVGLHHFARCHLGRLLAEAEQVLVLAHFKGHALAGFGGAVKQLGMGFAAKGGKLAMHMGVKPRIRSRRCRRCGLCVRRCRENAITLQPKPRIDHAKCVGCGGCFAACQNKAVSILSLRGLKTMLFGRRIFREKLVEYAYAGHRGKRNIYLNFALNITRGCDCEPLPMRGVIPDIGIFASLDPVALDAACLAECARRGKRFKGGEQLHYAEKIGMGSTAYELVALDV